MKGSSCRALLLGLAAIVWGTSFAAAAAGHAAPPLRVEYDPPWLSVEAHEVNLLEVLALIGEKVGFRVVDGGGSSVRVTLSVARAPLEEVLRRLLRSENHTILYHRAPAGIVRADTIIVSSPSAARRPRPPMPAAPDGNIVSDQLRAQALVRPPLTAGNAAEAPPTSPALGVGESLAIATRQALQDMNALMQGLRAAADSHQGQTAGVE